MRAQNHFHFLSGWPTYSNPGKEGGQAIRAKRLLKRNSAIEFAQRWCPGGCEMVNRRGFLSSFAGAAAVGTALNFVRELFAQLSPAPSQLPDRGLYDSNEEAYWTELRKPLLIPRERVC